MKAREGFRPDVEGLRAVAVLGVVLYHAGLGAVSGGYAGVDVFFVLSGYLITGGLWRELRDKGRIGLGAFYGRRARRLLPAAGLVLVVTLLVARECLPPLEVKSVASDALAAALYVANYRFAFMKTNYLSATATPSPLQHYWSLGVEEQFYALWPALLLAGFVAWRKAPKVGVAVTLGAVMVGSFALSLHLTHSDQPWAFFSLPTRAWELGAGAVVALAAPRLGRLPAWVTGLLGWGGLAAVLWSFFALSGSTPFPGTAALVPVLGAAAVVAAGCARPVRGAGALLRLRPMQLIGRISYSWYLWHFPVLILAPAIAGHSLGIVANLGLCAFSGLLALATTVLVENPIRFSGWVQAAPANSLVVGGAVMAGVTLTVGLLLVSLPSLRGTGRSAVAALSAPEPASAQTATSAPTGSGPTPQELALGRQLGPILSAAVHENQVPANLDPPLASPGDDPAAPFVDGCLDGFTDADLHSCVFGAAAPTSTIVLFGDSHAAMWFPPLDAMANARGWRLVVMTKATCPPIDIEVYSPDLGRQYSECDQFRAAALARIAELRPSLVVLGVARHYSSLYHLQVYGPGWLSGISSMVRQLRRYSPHVVLLGPVPKPGTNIPQCLSAHLDDAVQCTQPIQPAIYNPGGAAAERAATTSAGGQYLDVEPWMCTPTVCAVIVGNLMVFRDDNHLSGPFASWLAPVLEAHLDALIANPQASS